MVDWKSVAAFHFLQRYGQQKSNSLTLFFCAGRVLSKRDTLSSVNLLFKRFAHSAGPGLEIRGLEA